MDWSTFSIGNAAGTVKAPGELFDALLQSEVSDITIGTITRGARQGNSGRTLYSKKGSGTTVNCIGMKNPGVDYIENHVRDMKLRAQDKGKKLRWSVAGASPMEYAEVAERLQEHGTIELDFSCSGVWLSDGTQMMMPAEDTELMRHIMNKVSVNVEARFDIKLPYLYPMMLKNTVTTLRTLTHRVGHIVTCNTLANGIPYKKLRRALDSPGGFGGVGGEPLAYLMPGQVAMYQKPLHGSRIGVIGVGAVNSGERAWIAANEGAVGIQVCSAFLEEGPDIFTRILSEIKMIEDDEE